MGATLSFALIKFVRGNGAYIPSSLFLYPPSRSYFRPIKDTLTLIKMETIFQRLSMRIVGSHALRVCLWWTCAVPPRSPETSPSLRNYYYFVRNEFCCSSIRNQPRRADVVKSLTPYRGLLDAPKDVGCSS